MNNFQAWIDQADIPTQGEDGQWFDLEDGIAYDPQKNYGTKQPRQSIRPKSQAARDVAKFFGGRALKGTKKQKEWAEEIRAEKLGQMDEAQAMMAVDPNGLLTHSKFWIENRRAHGAKIGEFVQRQKALLKRYNAARDELDQEAVARIAAEYNELTSKWGF
jgi:hypothetical protein